VPDELRKAFREELAQIDRKVVQLFALVTESLAAATETLLSDDRESARQVVDRDWLIDSLNQDIEQLVQRQFTLQAPLASDMRYLLSVLRIVPELERSGDLAEHIAQRAVRGLANELSPQIRGLLERMGEEGIEMWRVAADAYAARDAGAASLLNERDDQLDDLHEQLTAALVSGAVALPAALQTALVGRFYERLGDHAVHVAERVRYLAIGA
jgi:phosphate transport system protein